MTYLQEHLNYIYLREDLIDNTKDIVNNKELSKIPSEKQASDVLNNVPILSMIELKKQASTNPKFKKYYNEALKKLGSEGDSFLGDGLAVLYASTRSSIDGAKDPSLRNKLTTKLDKLFSSVWNNPGKLATKGFKIWVASFLMLFMFWWIPSAREILKGARKVAMIMMMIGIVFATIKFFMKRIKKI